MNNKAISPLMATTLLVAFTLIVAIIAGIWLTKMLVWDMKTNPKPLDLENLIVDKKIKSWYFAPERQKLVVFLKNGKIVEYD